MRSRPGRARPLRRRDRLSRTGDLPFDPRLGGRPAILAHVYGTSPAAIARVIVFHIRHTPGTFGTVLTGRLPPTVNHHGYIKLIALELHREFN